MARKVEDKDVTCGRAAICVVVENGPQLLNGGILEDVYLCIAQRVPIVKSLEKSRSDHRDIFLGAAKGLERAVFIFPDTRDNNVYS